jgi:flagellar hook-associated protein FlgK
MNTISTALSGMNAASLALATSAHNIANNQTPGFRRQSVARQATEGGGVSAEVIRADAAGASLAEDIVTQMSASYAFKANLKVLKVQDEVLGSLLDTQA